MRTKTFLAYFLSFFLLFSCSNNKESKPKVDDYFIDDHPVQHLRTNYFGITLDKYLPMGSIYADSAGLQYAYRYIRTIITNDSLIPVHLRIEFPESYTAMTPVGERKFKAFVLPDTMTAEKQNDSAANYGRVGKGLENYLDKELNKHSSLDKTILPNEKYELRIGLLFFPCDGVTRIELFSNGHKHNLRMPVIATDLSNVGTNKLNLMLGTTLNSSYSVINCGQLSY